MAKCRLCGADPQKDNVVLVRVNEYGTKGIWQCSPSCDHEFKDKDQAILHGLKSAEKK